MIYNIQQPNKDEKMYKLQKHLNHFLYQLQFLNL